MSGVASEYLDDYAKESNNTVLDKMLGWSKTIFNCFNALASAVAGAFVLNNLNDITIYSKIRAQNYIAVFEDFSYELSIEDVIEKCSNDKNIYLKCPLSSLLCCSFNSFSCSSCFERDSLTSLKVFIIPYITKTSCGAKITHSVQIE